MSVDGAVKEGLYPLQLVAAFSTHEQRKAGAGWQVETQGSAGMNMWTRRNIYSALYKVAFGFGCCPRLSSSAGSPFSGLQA